MKRALHELFAPLIVAWHWVRWGYYAMARDHVHPLHPDLFYLGQQAKRSRDVVLEYLTQREARRELRELRRFVRSDRARRLCELDPS